MITGRPGVILPLPSALTGSRAQNTFPTPPPTTRGGVFVDRDEVAMPEQTRSQRNLAQDINHAHDQLKRARQDGGCTAIVFWTKRRDELLERWRVVTAPAKQPQGSAHT